MNDTATIPDPYALPECSKIPAETEHTIRVLMTREGFPYGEALDWLLSHGDSMITEGHPGGVKDCIKAMEAGDALAKCKLLLMLTYHRQDWLHDRMGFHALAGIQEWGSKMGLSRFTLRENV